MKICPKNPAHKTFVTTAHEVHDWVVYGDGRFVSDLGCSEVAHDPNDGNCWTCHTCGAEAVNEESIKQKRGKKK